MSSYIKINISKRLNGIRENMNLDISLNIKKRDFIAISGESGSGKTTLLRIIAGLEKADGEIIVDNEVWQKDKYCLATKNRDIGFVFQKYSLFDNMNVLENLLFVKKDLKLANHLLDISNMTTLKNRAVYTLSGGQQQRVSLCRAFMSKPKVMLLDEPFSALDYKVKYKLYKEIKLLHKEFNTTIIMVSHDIGEIYKLANKIIVLDNGIITKEDENIFSKKNSSILVIKSSIIDIVKNNNLYQIVVFLEKQLINLSITHKQAKEFKVGQEVSIHIDASISKIRAT